jgi:hypothetical protein
MNENPIPTGSEIVSSSKNVMGIDASGKLLASAKSASANLIQNNVISVK